MIIAVTGCNGRVGRRVVLFALKEGHTVVGIDSADAAVDLIKDEPGFSFRQADLKDYDATEEALTGCEAVVQLAGAPHPKDWKTSTHHTNVVITWNILRAAAELGINRISQASSVNVLRGVFSVEPKFDYFPIDEDHPCLPDEPYGLSKLVAEMQADTIIRRYPSMRVASIRLHWSVPSRSDAFRRDYAKSKGDLWSYVQHDSGAEAFLRGVTSSEEKWAGHERFFIAAPRVAVPDDEGWLELKKRYFPDVPIREGWVESKKGNFFDCSKAERLLEWVHHDYA
ncbi:NAD(P)-binding protein [Coniophora puteana RWD-64-598 SS2]|uniref:NAD(P)-binding protein n=1 Tax=Coniophora puteana (strain RWD-64-598) TaxID=741705 RepID=A0A5M3MFI5_CONPW|nr:NAD(P)-binding protein [Coniophora puteana RWD-64-598 SS2]EIW77756.1 NAD(P)-binding protein [Coniophora puteana RWD-64-598 SS2]